MSLCPNNNNAYSVDGWSILILLWWKFLDYMFAHCGLTCPFVYYHFALFVPGDLLSFYFQIIQMFMLIKHSAVIYEFIEFIFHLWSVGFQHPLPDIVFYWYRGSHHTSHCSSYYACLLCHFYFVSSALVIICSMPNHSSMHPRSSVFLLYCYSWSCG